DHVLVCLFFFFQAEDGIRDFHVTGVQTCALPILATFNVGHFNQGVAGCLEVRGEAVYGKEGKQRYAQMEMLAWRDWISRQSLDKIGRASCREGVWVAGGRGPWSRKTELDGIDGTK